MSEPSANSTTHEACEGCGEFLDVSAFGPFEKVICPLCEAETHAKRDFGCYRLLERYAVGGMSVIFVGQDTTLDRKVAIKVLNEDYCNDEIRIQAFENEARLTAQVNHPNVVKVYSVGRAHGRFYLVMELLEGESFERSMSQRGALPEGEVLDIALQVAAGLRAAKDAGMIHRDVKPGNILIDAQGHASLVDFGLALITQEGSAQAEEIWATPFYVPPEALERGIEDFRSDIYAFGATLYHALAGRPPFETTSTSNSVLRGAKQTIPRLCHVADWITPRSGEAIDRMMAFKPEDRWGSYQEVIQALENARRHIRQNPAAPVQGCSRRQRRQTSNEGKKRFVTALLLGSIAIASSLALWQPWEKNTSVTDPVNTASPEISEQKDALFTPTQSDDERSNEAWQGAHALVSEGDYSQASQRLAELSQRETLSKSHRSWAALEASVNALLDGQPGQARLLAKQAFTVLRESTDQSAEVAKLRHYGQVLHRVPPPSLAEVSTEPGTISDALGAFAIALKLWEQGQWESALPIFAKVRSATLPHDFAWFTAYQSLADTYLADGQILSQLKGLPTPTDAAQATSQIAQLAESVKLLRTKGRAIYNLRSRQAYLTRIRKSF